MTGDSYNIICVRLFSCNILQKIIKYHKLEYNIVLNIAYLYIVYILQYEIYITPFEITCRVCLIGTMRFVNVYSSHIRYNELFKIIDL